MLFVSVYDDMIAAAAVSAAMADMAGFVGGQDGVDSAVNHGYKVISLQSQFLYSTSFKAYLLYM